MGRAGFRVSAPALLGRREADNLYWYATGTAPILTYMTLTGDRVPLKNGVLPELLTGQEILASGRVPDWSLTCSMGYLNKAATLTGDGRWVEYRSRCKTDTDAFRLGQSYWPEESIVAHEPGHGWQWNIHRCRSRVLSRATGFDLDESFYFGSFRTTTDENGDFISSTVSTASRATPTMPSPSPSCAGRRHAAQGLPQPGAHPRRRYGRADHRHRRRLRLPTSSDTAACVGEVPRAAAATGGARSPSARAAMPWSSMTSPSAPTATT